MRSPRLIAEQRAKPAEVPYGYLLIDCPPSLNLLTLNAMTAAHAVLVPVQCEFFALEGISQLKETIDQIRATLNPSLEIQGVVLTMHDARTSLSKEVEEEVRSFFGAKVYATVIRRNVKVAEAPSHGKPILHLRLRLQRQPGLHPARHRGHPARAPAEGGLRWSAEIVARRARWPVMAPVLSRVTSSARRNLARASSKDGTQVTASAVRSTQTLSPRGNRIENG